MSFTNPGAYATRTSLIGFTEKLPADIKAIIPQSRIATSTLEYAHSVLPSAILNHSLRVYIYAHKIATISNSTWSAADKLDLLFAACLFHDSGVCQQHNGEERFEIEGADAAAHHLEKHDVSETAIHEVWVAIALHTSAGIADRISEMARIVRTAVLIDFGELARLSRKVTIAAFGAESPDPAFESFMVEVEKSLPRLEAEEVLGNAVLEQAMDEPQKAPAASWPGCLLRARIDDPHWTGVNPAF